MYVYIQSEISGEDDCIADTWTVGFYDPNGVWVPESDYETRGDAAKRVAYLNGNKQTLPPNIQEALNSGDGVYRP